MTVNRSSPNTTGWVLSIPEQDRIFCLKDYRHRHTKMKMQENFSTVSFSSSQFLEPKCETKLNNRNGQDWSHCIEITFLKCPILPHIDVILRLLIYMSIEPNLSLKD
jgi:hypothetical protein